MKNSFRFAAFVVALTALCSLATAQFDVNGPNASLTMQGAVPSTLDPVDHDVLVASPGIFNITIDSGVNSLAGIIMLASFDDPTTGNTIPTPLWGGNIDLGNGTIPSIQIIADGISFSVNPTIDIFYKTNIPTFLTPASTFTQAYSVSQFLCGARIAWQAIVQDPFNPPINIDNTECGDANFTGGQEFLLLTGDDGIVNLPFITGSTFPFHGVAYTDIWVEGNGYACFGGITTVNAAGFTLDVVSMVNAQPAIMICQTDWGMGNSGALDGCYYLETGNSVLISWGDTRGMTSGAIGMAHFADVDRNNQLDMTLQLSVDPNVNICGTANPNEGSFTLAYPRMDQTAVTRPGDGALGHTSGGVAIGANAVIPASSDLEGQVSVSGVAVPMVEEHNRTGGNAVTLGWDGAGAARAYNEFRNWTGNSVTFSPITSVIAGDLGYIAIPANNPADDVIGITQPSISNAGGVSVTAVGKFFGFGAGTVTITDSTATVFNMIAPTVISGTGPIFNSEGLTFTTPAGMALGLATMTINFGSGYVESVAVTIAPPCSLVGPNFTLLDDGFAIVPLSTNTVTMYGTVYTSLYVCSNGTINMSAGHGDFSSTMAEFFGGNGTAGNKNVAYCYMDMNRGGTASGSTWNVVQDTCTGTTTVNANNQIAWNTIQPMGNFAITFDALGPDSVQFDYSGAIDDAGAGDGAIVGYGDGITGGTDTNMAGIGGFAANVPGYTTTTAPESVAEQINSGIFATTMQGINGTGIWFVLNDGLGNLVLF